ncbi:MAG TPA: glycosyl hydrolase family 18 protein [Bacteroidales bacterium]|nr:glycosyl hydrolase family 18 protein [Bacteroidales bacterium]
MKKFSLLLLVLMYVTAYAQKTTENTSDGDFLTSVTGKKSFPTTTSQQNQDIQAESIPQNFKSIVQEENEKYSQYDFHSNEQWDSLFYAQNPGISKTLLPKQSRTCTLNKVVYGWNPYWAGTDYLNYQWNLLSHICHFSYEVNYSTGNANNTHNWATDAAVNAALANGVKVDLCVTLMNQANLTSFLANSTARQTLITNLINLIQTRGANGVNIDFEGMASSDSINFKTFMIALCNQMHAALPGSQVSYCLPAVEWTSNKFSARALANYVDMFIIMGYDYYYGGSSMAGPTDPLYNFNTGYNYTLTKSITYYQNQGVPSSKIILGLPYYGRQWATASDAIYASTTATGTSLTYKAFRADNNGYYDTKLWNNASFTPYYTFQIGSQWYQCWIDDAYSLGKRFDLVNQRGIGGIGIWALGYDNGYLNYWNKISDKFSTCATVPCSDTIYDMGGPERNYYNAEDYTYTIAPNGAFQVGLQFTAFDVEAGSGSSCDNDYLEIFNGPNTASPSLGKFCNTTGNPGLISSTGNSLTLKWHSDAATLNAGFRAVWQCISDNVAPNTTTSVAGVWQTQDFTADFTDTDNTGGSGIEKRYYQVLDFDGTEWHANANRGFFCDNFDSYNTPVWSVPANSGTWAVNSGKLVQTDTSVSNTNIFAQLNQGLSNRYLYDFNIKIDPATHSTSQHRFGFHFYSDSGSLSNRGNSYFIFFRQETSSLEFYRVENNVYAQTQAVNNITTNLGQWYNLKIIHDRITGKISVYRDNILLSSWTDPNPLTTAGKYFSFRTGNSKVYLDELKIYRSRYPSVTVTVGNSPDKDIRYQNPGPATHGAKIKSIVNDLAGNLSAIDYYDLNIDWTPPVCGVVNDGQNNDTDTTTSPNTLAANWPASADPNSGIAGYQYAIGTVPGDTSVLGWTANALDTSVVKNGLSLSNGQTYYFSIKTINGAGLESICSSDGVTVVMPTGINENAAVGYLSAVPNPFNSTTTINYFVGAAREVKITLTDMYGREILLLEKTISGGKNTLTIDAEKLNLSKGMYVLRILTADFSSSLQIINY